MTEHILEFITKSEPKTRLRWYAVRCEVRHEIKASVAIAREGIHVFVPFAYREEKQGKWLVAVQDGLLFPRYIFVAMRANGPWGKIADADGVERVMCCRNRRGEPVPTPIPYREMRKIRTKHVAGEKRRSADRFKPGQTVRIAKGPFEGFDGIFEKPVKDRLRILVSIFGTVAGVEMEEDDVRAA